MQYRYEIRHNVSRKLEWFVFDNKTKKVIFESEDADDCHRYLQDQQLVDSERRHLAGEND